MFSASNSLPVSPSTRLIGKKYPWQNDDSNEEQQKSCITKSIEKFLASIKNDPIGPALAKFSAEILLMHDNYDHFMMQVNNKAQRRMVDEKEGMEKQTTNFIDDVSKGLKKRLDSIKTTEPLPVDFADDMETVS